MPVVRTLEEIDVPVFRYYATPPEAVCLPTGGLAKARRKRLHRSLVAMFDEEHWAHKRGHVPTTPPPVNMAAPFDGSRFNFNKADVRETIGNVDLCGDVHAVLVNVCPIMTGHTVVPLWGERELPQGALGESGVHCMFALAARSRRKDFRVVYNSLGAYASVNHLHVHGIYASALDGSDGTDCFPIETASRRLHAIGSNFVKAYTLCTDPIAGCHLNCIAFEGSREEVAKIAGRCVEYLTSQQIPHNLMVRERPTPACFLIPRQPQENFRVAQIGCNAAVCELCGFLVMHSSEAYEELTLALARETFQAGASLPQSEFDAVLRHYDSLFNWWRARTLRCAGFTFTAGLVLVAAVGTSYWKRRPC